MNKATTPLQLFYHWEKTKPNNTWLHQPEDREWSRYSWAEAGELARRMASALLDLNLPVGSKIGILSKNSVYWYLCDLAIMMSGHVSVPAFTTMNNKSSLYLLESSETKALFVGPAENWQSLKDSIPSDIKIIGLPGANLDSEVSCWDKLIEKFPPIAASPAPSPDALCTIIYTSGTTGLPKGVMHSHASLAGAGLSMLKTYRTSEEDRFLSFLPLSHIFERAVLMQSLACGGQVYFNESLESFPEDMQICQPTWFCAAPRIWQKFQQSIIAKIGADKLKLMLGDPASASQLQAMVQQSLGLDKAKILITGGGQTPSALYIWYQHLGMPLCDIYGMTEAAPATTNLPWLKKDGTAGRPIDGAEVMIADNGEVLTKTPCMMTGYYNDPAKSAEDLAGGWMHTGDKGSIDADGFLHITGRVKEIFKTAKGKYVAPSSIENLMADTPFLENLCLVGSGLPATILLVNLTTAAATESKDVIRDALLSKMNDVNKVLDKHERMSHIIVGRETWTIDNELLSHTTKIKRSAIESKYQQTIVEVAENT
ncbi:MAG: AMP-binding protein, partial [Spongiibacteraceae bacterium]